MLLPGYYFWRQRRNNIVIPKVSERSEEDGQLYVRQDLTVPLREPDEIEDDKDKDDDDSDEPDDDSSSSSTTEVAAATTESPTPRTTSQSESLSTTTTTSETSQSPITSPVVLTTSSPTPLATTVWMTTSSVSTVTEVSSTSSALGGPSTIVVGQADGQGDRDREPHHDDPHHPPPNNNKFAIAFGTVGAVGLLVGAIWAYALLRRRRNKRARNQMEKGDYESSLEKPRRFNFGWPSMPMFSRSSGESNGRISAPFGATKRSNSSIMDEAMRAAYGTEDTSFSSTPRGFLDEKRLDPNYPLPLLEPTPIPQASIRKSIVSWFKRSSGHHPLQLNPMSRWSRSTMQSSAPLTGGLSRRSSTRSNTNSQYASSTYSVGVNDMMFTMAGVRETIPPVPKLDLQRAYTGTSTVSTLPQTIPPDYPTPAQAAVVASPEPAFSRDQAQAYFNSHWATMSRVSSVTAGTRTTMGGESAGMRTPGLSPPSYYLGSNRGTSTVQSSPSGNASRESALTDASTSVGSEGGSTNLPEDVLDLYMGRSDRGSQLK